MYSISFDLLNNIKTFIYKKRYYLANIKHLKLFIILFY